MYESNVYLQGAVSHASGIWPHFPSDLFAEKWLSALAEVTNVSLVPITPVTDPAWLVTPIPLCWSHTPNHILEICFLFKCVCKGSLDFTSCSFYCLNDFLIKKIQQKLSQA